MFAFMSFMCLGSLHYVHAVNDIRLVNTDSNIVVTFLGHDETLGFDQTFVLEFTDRAKQFTGRRVFNIGEVDVTYSSRKKLLKRVTDYRITIPKCLLKKRMRHISNDTVFRLQFYTLTKQHSKMDKTETKEESAAEYGLVDDEIHTTSPIAREGVQPRDTPRFKGTDFDTESDPGSPDMVAFRFSLLDIDNLSMPSWDPFAESDVTIPIPDSVNAVHNDQETDASMADIEKAVSEMIMDVSNEVAKEALLRTLSETNDAAMEESVNAHGLSGNDLIGKTNEGLYESSRNESNINDSDLTKDAKFSFESKEANAYNITEYESKDNIDKTQQSDHQAIVALVVIIAVVTVVVLMLMSIVIKMRCKEKEQRKSDDGVWIRSAHGNMPNGIPNAEVGLEITA